MKNPGGISGRAERFDEGGEGRRSSSHDFLLPRLKKEVKFAKNPRKTLAFYSDSGKAHLLWSGPV